MFLMAQLKWSNWHLNILAMVYGQVPLHSPFATSRACSLSGLLERNGSIAWPREFQEHDRTKHMQLAGCN